MAGPVIALLTDFGSRDTYVAEVKGAILTINPTATLVDITHEVPPQDINAGGFLLANAVGAFPPGTVYVAVVDPGVGTARRPLIVETPGGSYVGPDNGLFSRVIWGDQPDGDDGDLVQMAYLPPNVKAYCLKLPSYWRDIVSDTFHGRDIFGPVAAHRSLGVEAAAMGDQVHELWRVPSPSVSERGGALIGQVVYVDTYGNLVTNIPARRLPKHPIVEVAGHVIQGLSASYEAEKSLVALVGSHDYLEIAKPLGSAAQDLHLGQGARVQVTGT